MADARPLVLVGAGGVGREVAALVDETSSQPSPWELVGFADDDPTLHGTTVMGHPVQGGVEWLADQSDVQYAITIGDGTARREVTRDLAPAPVDPARLVHPSVSLHHTTSVEPGAILCEGASPTVNVEIGRHVIVDQQCTIGHDAILDDFVSLRPGANISGSVHLHRGVTVGSGAVVLPGVTIGSDAVVGAGAVVTDDLPPDCTAVGVPARLV